MRTLSAMLLMVAFAALLGMIAWHLEQREREMMAARRRHQLNRLRLEDFEY